MSASLSVKARLFGIVAQYMAEADVRYYLGGVLAKPHPTMPGVLLCATNGHQLAIAHDPTGSVSRATLVRATSDAIASALGKGERRIEIRDDRLIVVKDAKQVRRVEDFVQPENATHPDGWASSYPEVLSILPADFGALQEDASSPLAARYVKQIGRTAVLLSGKGGFDCVVRHLAKPKADDGQLSSAVYTLFSREPGLLVITMPIRECARPSEPEFVRGLHALGMRNKADHEAAKEAMRKLRAKSEQQVNQDAEEDDSWMT